MLLLARSSRRPKPYSDEITNEAERLDPDQFARSWEETGEFELRQILYWRWDPIGVSDAFPRTADEYDAYAPRVVSALRNHASPLAADIVLWFETSQRSWSEYGAVRR